MADKRKPTYDLIAFKAAFDDVSKLNVTAVAVRSTALLVSGELKS